ncbi:hypothetical protein [Brachybacterium sp. NPDC056505]|uniref:hypothetical protein n=1 Tax=Brachybacterium sp. NPDC056505 TaxID=3345843 RepID=UPI00366BCD22
MPRLRINRSVLNDYMAAEGIRSRNALAKRMGVNSATVYRVLSGSQAPGERFYLGLKTAFPGRSMDDLLVKQ